MILAQGRAETMDNSLRRIVGTDFLNGVTGFDTYSAGSGSGSFTSAFTGGVIRLSSGATPASEYSVLNSNNATLVAAGDGASWYVEGRGRFELAADADTLYQPIGVSSNVTYNSDVAFGVHGASDPDYLTLRIKDGASITYVASGIPVDLDHSGDALGFHRIGLGFDFANGIVTAWYDDAVACETTSLGDLTSDPLFMYASVQNGAGGGSRQMYIDWIAAAVA